MTKADEVEFARAVLEWLGPLPFNGAQRAAGLDRHLRALIESRSNLMPPKRARFILEKWDDRNWYEFGVSFDLGWLTPRGVFALRAMIGEPMTDAEWAAMLDWATR